MQTMKLNEVVCDWLILCYIEKKFFSICMLLNRRFYKKLLSVNLKKKKN